jgi:hypothetical protein
MTDTPTNDRHSFTVFYSWQSDLEGRANRNLIEDALKKATKTLRADDSLRVDPVMDRDTAGKAGSPDISATILAKIDAANAFVADVSFITPPTAEEPKQKRCPNPNVLIELGYAVRRHGWERVLLVFNEHYGVLEDLPFDIRSRRVITYKSAPDDSDRAAPRRLLHDRFVADLRVMANSPLPPARTPARDAVDAIEEQRRNRATAVRTATAETNARLLSVAPNLSKETLDSAAFITGLDAATPAIVEYLEIASAAASVDDRDAAIELIIGLEKVAVGYNTPPGYSGTLWVHQFDYWKQVGYELLLGIIALLLRDRRFETLGEVLKTRLRIPNAPTGGSDQVLVRYLNPRTFVQQDAWGQRQLGNGSRYISPIGQLLKERFEGPPLANIVTWPEIQAADLFLAIWTAGNIEPHDRFADDWVAHAAVLMNEPPRFLTDAIRIGAARQVAQALGLPTAEALRDTYIDRVHVRLREPFRDSYRLSGMNFPNAHKIGSAP